MTVSTALDPVGTVKDILEYASDPGKYGTSYGTSYGSAQLWEIAGAPDIIERYEESDFSTKKRRDMKDAVYIMKTDPGSNDKLGAAYDGYIDDHTVRVEIWTPESEAKAHEYLRDIREIMLRFTDDNQVRTEWTQIAPVGDADERAGSRARGVDHYVMAVLVQLLAARD